MSTLPATVDPPRPRPGIAFKVFLGALAVRLLAVVYMSVWPPAPLVVRDTHFSYRPLALGLLAGDGYRLAGSETEASRIAPGFPFFLAAVYGVAGPEAPTWLLGVVNAVLRAGVTLIVYLLGCRVLGPGPALAAAVLHAVDPWEAFWTPFIGKDSLAIFLFACACYAIQSALDSGRGRWAGTAGFVVGLATLTRYAALGLLPCALVGLVSRPKRDRLPRFRAIVWTAAMGLGFMAAVGPWLARNDRLLGQPVLTPHFFGRYLYVSNGPGLAGQANRTGYAEAHPQGQYTRTVEGMDASPTTKEWAFTVAALNHIAADPGSVVVVLGDKLVSMWRPTFQGSSLRNRVVLGAPYVLFMGLAAIGVVGCLRTRARVGFPLTVIAFFFALHLVLFADIRFRLYLTPLLVLFAGWTADRFLRRADR